MENYRGIKRTELRKKEMILDRKSHIDELLQKRYYNRLEKMYLCMNIISSLEGALNFYFGLGLISSYEDLVYSKYLENLKHYVKRELGL